MGAEYEQGNNEHEDVRRGILGEGTLQIQSLGTDPLWQDEVAAIADEDAKNKPSAGRASSADTFVAARDCLEEYRTDSLSAEQEDLATLVTQPGKSHSVYINDGICFYVPSILNAWERNLAAWDNQAQRVKPQYPADAVRSQQQYFPMHPDIIRDVFRLGRPSKEEVPALYFLVAVAPPTLLDDVYRWIVAYHLLGRDYDRGHYPDADSARAAANRRDLQARAALNELYKKYAVSRVGGSRYWLDTPSEMPSRTGSEIFYQCFLTALLRQNGFRLQYDAAESVAGKPIPDNLRWVAGRAVCKGVLQDDESTLDPCRDCELMPVILGQ